MGASLYARSYAVVVAGNISARLADGWVITPIEASLGRLKPSKLAKVGMDGKWLSGDKPSKTIMLRQVIYGHSLRPMGIVHTHSRRRTPLQG